MFDLHRLEMTQYAIDNAVDPILWLDRSGKFIYANKAAVDHFGYPLQELLSMTVHQIDSNFPEEKWHDHWRYLQQKKTLAFESLYKTKGNHLMPVGVLMNHLNFSDAEFQCAHVRTISSRGGADEILSNNEQRFRKMLDATSDGMWDRNLVTGKVHYGANWASSLGYREEDVISGKIRWEDILHPEDKEKTLQAVRDHLNGKTPRYEAEFRLKNNYNQYQWIQARGKIIEFDEDGKPLRFVGTHNDITNRKTAEDALLKRSEDTMIFAYSVAHDLKNPAIAIECLAQRFRQKFDDLTDQDKLIYCEKILDSSRMIASLVDKINCYISAKETIITLEEFHLKEIVRICKEEFTAQLETRMIKWSEFQEHPVVKADRIGLARILRNLVENALKYGGEHLSKITIGYQNTAGFHVISVRDNGVGMKKEDSPRIFEPFQRRGSAAGQGGSGLGLAIVKEIAEKHKGEVWVELNKRRGLQFCVAISKKL
jgi:PAS domain S-box-containing protein